MYGWYSPTSLVGQAVNIYWALSAAHPIALTVVLLSHRLEGGLMSGTDYLASRGG